MSGVRNPPCSKEVCAVRCALKREQARAAKRTANADAAWVTPSTATALVTGSAEPPRRRATPIAERPGSCHGSRTSSAGRRRNLKEELEACRQQLKEEAKAFYEQLETAEAATKSSGGRQQIRSDSADAMSRGALSRLMEARAIVAKRHDENYAAYGRY